MLFSLAFNIISKLPSFVAIFFILPRIHRSLGGDSYGHILSALALGSTVGFPLIGLNIATRRMLSSAYAAADNQTQSNVFVTSAVLTGVCSLLASLAAAIVSIIIKNPQDVTLIVVVVSIAAYFNFFDNVRASYNEHYVTAVLQTISQAAFFGILLVANLPVLTRVGVAILLQTALPAASVVTAITLLRKRAFLLRGQFRAPGHIIAASALVSISEVAVTVMLNLSVVWFGATAGTVAVEWYGTLSRLFMALLTPAMLVLVPIVYYIPLIWRKLSERRVRMLTIAFGAGSLAYGLIVALVIVVFGGIYLNSVMHLRYYGGGLDNLCVGLFFGGIVCQKSYAAFIFSIYKAQEFTLISAVVMAGSGLIGALASVFLEPLHVLDVFCMLCAIGLSGVVIYDVWVVRAGSR